MYTFQSVINELMWTEQHCSNKQCNRVQYASQNSTITIARQYGNIPLEIPILERIAVALEKAKFRVANVNHYVFQDESLQHNPAKYPATEYSLKFTRNVSAICGHNPLYLVVIKPDRKIGYYCNYNNCGSKLKFI